MNTGVEIEDFYVYLCEIEEIMKKINITTGALLVYLIVMSVIGWPGNKPEPDYTQYFLVIAIVLSVIFLLRFVQIKRLKAREKLREENKTKYSED